jgi:hypothetical protein
MMSNDPSLTVPDGSVQATFFISAPPMGNNHSGPLRVVVGVLDAVLIVVDKYLRFRGIGPVNDNDIYLCSNMLSAAYLMSPLLGHRSSFWMTDKENEPKHTTRAQCGLVGANICKCNRGQRLNVSSEAQ